jgi:hypothetical protein
MSQCIWVVFLKYLEMIQPRTLCHKVIINNHAIIPWNIEQSLKNATHYSRSTIYA